MSEFFDILQKILSPRGSFIVSSRNRLFNIFSISASTLIEINSSNLEALMKEALALASNAEIEELMTMNCASLQKADTKHERTGVDVTTRFQYTPVQLMKMLSERGLKAVEIVPIHIHGVPPAFKDKHPEIHASISNGILSNVVDQTY